MENTNRRFVTGMFEDRDSAERAYASLRARGYSDEDLNLMMTDEARKRHFTNSHVETELGNKAAEGAGTGGAIGTTLGAIAGAIAAIGTNLILPGVGLVVAGPLAGALAGAGAGAATGGIIGALIGAGIPEERAKIYEDGVKKGNIVLGVRSKTDEDADYFENEWRTYNGREIYR
jgi:hypothetical protein